MANTFTFTPDDVRTVEGNHVVEYGTLTIAGTYTNPGGDAVPATGLVRMSRIDGMSFMDGATSIGQVARYDRTTRKVSLFQSTTGAPVNLVEVANGGTVAGTIRVRVHGTGL